ncbi:MAG: hypothetical protein EOO85_25600 [Pedobacter sp.]|nr:MAG: hypothetical protein EOO85_25600 [Pedobacter sp.]
MDTFRYKRDLGTKYYELSNHLGNVLATVLDRKTGYGAANGEYTGFKADIASATDYYPFGMEMPGRTFSSENSRFGYNGQEKDNEVRGTGNSYAYEYRMYDSRIGRFLSVDPLTQRYPYYTPYQFAGNTPIMAIDLEGLEPHVTIKNVYHNNGYVKVVADVHIVAKVINMSSLKDINMNVVAANLQSDLASLSGLGYDIFKSPYRLKPDGKGSGTPVLSDVKQMHIVYEVNVTADVRSVQNIDQLSANDWVFAITNDVIGTKEKEYSGLAKMGGKVAIGEGREFGYGNNLDGRALTFHEFLHLIDSVCPSRKYV